MVISVSRRCDIPRFQFAWFMNRLNEGFVETVNPYNAGQIRRVSLLPEDVDAFVFWTRDPGDILDNTEELSNRGYPFYVMVSLTDYPELLEPNMAPAAEVLKSMKELAKIIGPSRVIWRYDPIIFTSVTDIDFHRRNFYQLAQNLTGSVGRVIVSIYDDYQKAKKRLEKLEQDKKLKMLSIDRFCLNSDFHNLLADLAKNAEAAGMEIQSCAEREDFSSLGIKPGACIDAALINKMCAQEFTGKDKNQRPGCLCCKSADIGAYNACNAHCVYCYAS